LLGEHTGEILRHDLTLQADELETLAAEQVI
jgi:hypothetical protein